ncbi:peptidoglycan DD-metalloendopeptidase family protein [Alkalimarinus sediminis]|uniref:Peptidoglycan DD-metalloendopeptidase family protein n=1 Tax=Alkalimarinus sediminis TaxID=1632866 RepID=A0A9E8HMI9_9ALTE|nr:peptidoglycan DD-metalloendopeptidase family protein [Alkalimarinus sediminis]UZW75631.1 peptidoglycan DD-metalloendopeptidase family protein [Alkalimarinus sediminis]
MYLFETTQKHPSLIVEPQHFAALLFRKIALLLLVIMLSACNSSGIYQDKNFNPPVYFGSHKVSQGDTLYSIAWRYGRDYKELASANGISPPYTIQLGQRIRLDLRGKVASKPKKTPSASHKKSKPVKSVSKNTSTAKPKKQTRVSTKSKTVKGVNWHWPHLGQIIARYSSAGNNNKGIDIAGNLGDSVVSAANGEVVYAGSGLLGYGKLIIINHNQHYLSAYAHNDRILVKEGQTIKQGQKIAEMGNTGTNRTKLHFEIRRDGKPVNPLNYLPKR